MAKIETKKTEKKELLRKGVVNCNLLNLRKEPNGDILEILEKGTEVFIVSEAENKEWLQLKSGFVMSKFIDIIDEAV